MRTRGHSVSHAYSHAKERERRRSNAFEYAYTTPTGWSIRTLDGVGDEPVERKPVSVDHWDGMEMESEMN